MQPTLLSDSTPRPDAAGPTVFPYGRVDGPSRWPARTSASTCPHCEGAAVNAQGIEHCPGCDWTGGA